MWWTTPATAYFRRAANADLALQAGPYTNVQGTKFWAGEDIDLGTSCTAAAQSANQQVTWSGINIAGRSNISFKGLFAAQGNIGGTWETLAFGTSQDFSMVEYRIDGGGLD